MSVLRLAVYLASAAAFIGPYSYAHFGPGLIELSSADAIEFASLSAALLLLFPLLQFVSAQAIWRAIVGAAVLGGIGLFLSRLSEARDIYVALTFAIAGAASVGGIAARSEALLHQRPVNSAAPAVRWPTFLMTVPVLACCWGLVLAVRFETAESWWFIAVATGAVFVGALVHSRLRRDRGESLGARSFDVHAALSILLAALTGVWIDAVLRLSPPLSEGANVAWFLAEVHKDAIAESSIVVGTFPVPVLTGLALRRRQASGSG